MLICVNQLSKQNQWVNDYKWTDNETYSNHAVSQAVRRKLHALNGKKIPFQYL